MTKIYPDNFEVKIGFDKVRALLKESCLSSLGQDRVDEIEFMTKPGKLNFELSLTDEFSKLLQDTDSFPINYFFDMRPALAKIRTEGRFLDVDELFNLKRSLETIIAIVRFIKQQKEESYPNLRKLLEQVQVFPYVKDRIDQILNQHGKIKDSASPELARIRRELFSKQGNVSKRLHAILKQAQRDGLIEDDASVSIRDGRPVIPISSALKRRISGIVHDESATGKTSYIEPAEVVELNNEIRELEYAERREIVRILVEVADDIRPYLDDLMSQYEFLGTIDFVRAKARLANRMEAIKPQIKWEGQLEWIKAVHPLLKFNLAKENRKVIPLDITLTPKDHLLLISGPNAVVNRSV